MPQPLDQQRRSNPLTPCIGRGFALDQRQHHRTLRQPDDGARQPVEITARNDHFLAPEIGDDALLGATLLAYVLDQAGANAVWAACGVTSPRSDAGRFLSFANATCAL